MSSSWAQAALALIVALGLMATSASAASVDSTHERATPAPTWHPNEQMPSLESAIDFRDSFGLRADVEYVARSLGDPAALPNMAWSVPLSPEEAVDMRARLEVQERVTRVIPSGARGYAGMYIDQHRGGMPVYLFTTVSEDVRAWITRHMSGIDFEIREVEATLAELTTLKESISAAREDLAAEGIEVVSVSVHVTENRVEVGVIKVTEEARERLAGFGGPLAIFADTRPVLDADTPESPFRHLWEPLDPADIKPRYYCDSMSFTASDLVAAVPVEDVDDSLAGAIAHHGRSLLEREVDWYVVKQEGPRVLAVAVAVEGSAIETMELARTTDSRQSTETWGFERGGNCEPQAAIGRGLGGQWRLDPRFPVPGPNTRRLHVIGDAGCNGTVRRGKAHIRMTSNAAIIAIPMGSKINSDMCHGLGPKRMTVTLPKPLGDRALYDAGSLRILRVAAERDRR